MYYAVIYSLVKCKMDDLADFFDFSRTFKRKTLTSGVNDGRIVTSHIKESQTDKRPEIGTEYAEEYVEQLRTQMARMAAVSVN